MLRIVSVAALGCLLVVATGCVRINYSERSGVAGAAGWSLKDARRAEKIETAVDSRGRHLEVEYHITPDTVPEAVQKAMDEKHPGGGYAGAEKEYNGGRLYYELAREINGFKVEAMFRPDGTLYEEEIEIPGTDVPAACHEAIAGAWPNGSVNAWEVIKNGRGKIVEYHVKLMNDGRALKVIVATNGRLVRAYREIPAEIEVPVPLPK